MSHRLILDAAGLAVALTALVLFPLGMAATGTPPVEALRMALTGAFAILLNVPFYRAFRQEAVKFDQLRQRMIDYETNRLLRSIRHG